MGTILLKNITVDGLQSDILVVGNRIDRTGPAGSCTAWPVAGEFEVLECSGKAALPGFINMHTHSGMSLMRGVGEDMPLEEWLQKIWKLEEGVCYPLVYDAVRLACVEMIKSGTTTFNDQYWLSEACHDAAVSMGMRPSMGYDLLDMCDPLTAARQKDECEEHYEKYTKLWKDDGSIYTLSFHAIYTVTEKMMLWASEFARSHGIKLHIHLSETRTEVENCKKAHGGLTPVEYLAELGILGPEVLAAHTLWLTEHDVELLGRYRVNCIHNVNSNLKLASGHRFLCSELLQAGANVCLGTDSTASSNNLDMPEAMKTAALLQKGWRLDTSALPLQELLDMATVNGAKALGIDAGAIRPGALADIAIIDTDHSWFVSPGPFLANFIYAAHSECIDSLICNGRFVMRRREIAAEEEVKAAARRTISKYY